MRSEASQREIALVTGISLGQVNAIIKKLCENNLLRQEITSNKKYKYVLTQRGLAERARLSNEDILSTIRNYNKIQDSLKGLLNRLHVKGYKEFVLEGDKCDLHDVIRDVFERLELENASLLWGPSEERNDQVVLNLGRRFITGAHTVNVLNELNV